MLKLTAENYFSLEADREYMSASQIKKFMACPAATMAELRGEYAQPVTSALLIGSYVDAFFEGTLNEFIVMHPELFKRDGSLKAEYERAQAMCDRAERDGLWMEYQRGEKQRIITGKIDGVPFKAKLDVYLPGQRIVDTKTVKNFALQYKPGAGKVSFAEAWNYDLQLAIYQHLEGNNLPCFIDAVTKEPSPDIAVIRMPQHYMDAALSVLRADLAYYDAIKNGQIEPPRCGHCAYCKNTKVLDRVQDITEFESEEEELNE
jgi:hypothetical protein